MKRRSRTSGGKGQPLSNLDHRRRLERVHKNIKAREKAIEGLARREPDLIKIFNSTVADQRLSPEAEGIARGYLAAFAVDNNLFREGLIRSKKNYFKFGIREKSGEKRIFFFRKDARGWHSTVWRE